MSGTAPLGPLKSAPPGARRREVFLAAALIVAAGAAAYANSLVGPLVFDDLGSIRDNATIRHLWPLGAVLAPPAGATVTGRPLVNLTFALNYALSGTRVWSYHALNLVIHLLAGLALFGVVRRTLARSDAEGEATRWAAAVALVWIVHPLLTESVTYLVQRAESLMGLFYLLTLYGFIRYAAAGGARRTGWAVLAFLACLAGMATKEVMVSAPLLVLLYDRTFVSGSFREAWRRHHRLLLALAATWLLLAWLAVGAGSRGGSAGFHTSVSWFSYARTQLWAIVLYLRLALCPYPLNFYYGRLLRTGGVETALDAAAVALLAAATLWALTRPPRAGGVRAAGFAGAWFFAILAPTSSVIPVATETVAEHRMYLALVPVVVLVVLGAVRRLRWPSALLVLAALVLALGGLTAARNGDYRSDIVLWRDTVERRPENPVARNNLGEALRTAGSLPGARGQFEEALRLDPDYADAANNLGVTLAALGRPDDAIRSLARAAAIKPDDAEAQLNWGNVLQETGALDAAIPHYAAALRLAPDRVDTHFNLGRLLMAEGRTADALVQFSAAVRLRPDDAEARNNLGILLAESGRPGEAEAQLTAAFRLKPDYPEAHNNLGSLLLSENRVAAAVAQFEEAARLGPRLPEPRYNLGVALLEEGRRADAAAQLAAALALRPDYPAAREKLGELQAGP